MLCCCNPESRVLNLFAYYNLIIIKLYMINYYKCIIKNLLIINEIDI